MGLRNAKSKAASVAKDVAEESSRGQLALIDVGPKQSKLIRAKAIAYRQLIVQRQEVLKREIQLKTQLVSLIKEEHLQTLPDGTTKFEVDGLMITVTPRDQLIRVTQVPGVDD